MKHALKIFLVSLVLVLAIHGIALATVITVPGDRPTIQLGLNAAQQGDTVLVAPGAYYEVVFWPATNGIKLLSEAGAESTTINGGNLSTVIYFPGLGGIDTTTVLRGFRITNGGSVSYGGGIYLTQSSPIIEQCIVDSNNAGGGIYCNNSSKPIIRSCSISQNSGGGIVFNTSSGGTVDSCLIFDNGDFGIKANALQSNPIISNSTVKNNGRGIYLRPWSPGFPRTSPMIINCIIRDNSIGIECDFSGDYSYDVGPTITGCLILRNSYGIFFFFLSYALISNTIVTENASGGIHCENHSWVNPVPTITNCTITRNSAPQGGGIYSFMGSPIIKHCTISDNRASDTGDGIYTTYASWPTLDSNNICYNGYGVYNNDNSQLLSAANQWWGDASGPYHPNYNPGGQGDSVNYFVYPLPYLTEADTIAPPIPPVGLDTIAVGNDSISLIWHASPIGDLAGYKVYFKSDSSGFPYSDTINVGLDTSVTILGLTTGTIYYIAVTCYDNSGNESWYSREIHATPGGTMLRGDANGDGKINSADVSYLINYLFVGGPAPQPWQAGDANCDGKINSADVTYLINYLFVGGPAPGC